MHRRLFVLSLALLPLAGCASTASKSGSQSRASAGMVNSKCPMVPDHPIKPGVTTTYKGNTVGFCCNGCIPEWNSLSDAQRDALLAKAK
ncbi:MAG: hypothetical protein SFY69_05420 [Planctomycetota bacterium]|nr:hypothetical protein [Planctomycetota bacterium]